MPSESMHSPYSQLPLASVRTDSGITVVPRLDLDDIQLSDAISRVLAQSAAAPVEAARTQALQARQDTPGAAVADTLDARTPDSWLLLVDLSAGHTSLGGSLLVHALLPGTPDRLEPTPPPADPAPLRALQQAVQELAGQGAILAARWRGRGGLVGCLVALAGQGSPHLAINIDPLLIEGHGDGRMDSGEAKNWTTQVSGLRHELTLRALFNEAPGLVLQVAAARRAEVLQTLREHGLGRNSHFIAHLVGPDGEAVAAGGPDTRLSIWRDAQTVFSAPLAALRGDSGAPATPPR